jgi:hypothetical protein
MKTCRRIAGKMTALEHLKLELRICDWPTQLNLAAAWAKPLLELKGSKGIEYVEVTLIHDAFNEQRLRAASRVVAQAMMSEEGRVRHALAEDAARTDKLKLRGGASKFPVSESHEGAGHYASPYFSTCKKHSLGCST